MPSKTSKRRGPSPEVLKIQGDWKAAIKKALAKPKPPEGWPKHSEKPAKAAVPKAK